MAFPDEFLDELRARTDIAGLIGRRVKLVRRGREHTRFVPVSPGKDTRRSPLAR